MQTDSNICVVCFVKMHFLCFDIFVIREFPLYFWCICLNGVPRKEEENDGNTLQRRKKHYIKKKGMLLFFLKIWKWTYLWQEVLWTKTPLCVVLVWWRSDPGWSWLLESLLWLAWTLLQRGSYWVTHCCSAAFSGLCCKGDHTEWLTIGLLHLLDFAAERITLSDSLLVCCIFWTLRQRGSHRVMDVITTHYHMAVNPFWE